MSGPEGHLDESREGSRDRLVRARALLNEALDLIDAAQGPLDAGALLQEVIDRLGAQTDQPSDS